MNSTGHFLQPGMTLVVDCLVFAVVLAVLSRAALPRLRAAIEDHHKRLEAADQAASEAIAVRDAALDEARIVTSTARHEARQILDVATSRRDELIAEGRRIGREEYEWTAARFAREQKRQAAASGHDQLTIERN